jgi:uncharacterized membrane protein
MLVTAYMLPARPPAHALSGCRILVAAVLFRFVAIYLIDASTGQNPDSVLRGLERFTLCAVIFSLIELVKTMSCRILSLRVHSESLFDTLQVCSTLHACMTLCYCYYLSVSCTMQWPAPSDGMPPILLTPCSTGTQQAIHCISLPSCAQIGSY